MKCEVCGGDVGKTAERMIDGLVAENVRMADLLKKWAAQGVFPSLAQETRDLLKEAGALNGKPA